ncbi:MAG: hypothetical protein AAGF49_15205, partial [Pseudomonadota bacterium]
MKLLNSASIAPLALIVSLATGLGAHAAGTDRGVLLNENGASQVPKVAVARTAPAQTRSDAPEAGTRYALREGRLGVGHLPQRRSNKPKAAKTHGILPMTRKPEAGTAKPRRQANRRGQPALRQRGVIRQASTRPQRQMDPRFLPATVPYSGRHKPGTIVIDTEEKYL